MTFEPPRPLQQWERKADQRLRALVERGGGVEQEDRVDVLVWFKGDESVLAELGLAVRSVAGDVATASLEIAAVPAVAGAPPVRFVELAREYRPD
jgi:hypothetical protein